MSKKPTFNSGESEEGKRRGMDLAAAARAELLRKAREIALRLGADGSGVTSDGVSFCLELDASGCGGNLGPAAGSIFKDGHWIDTGARVKSTRVTNHSRELRVWKRKNRA